MTLAQQQLQADYDKLKQEESDKSSKLQELMSVKHRPLRSLEKVKNNRALYDDKESSIKKLSEFSFNKIEMEKREKDLSNIILSGFNRNDDNNEMNTVVKSSPNHFPFLPFVIHFVVSTAVILFSRRSPHLIIIQNFY